MDKADNTYTENSHVYVSVYIARHIHITRVAAQNKHVDASTVFTPREWRIVSPNKPLKSRGGVLVA